MHTDTDERIEADAVVLTTELPDTYRLLGRTPRRLVPLRPSPSAVVAHVGCRSPGRELPHHHILFGDSWEQTFQEIIDDGVVMSDPSLLVTRPTAGDPTLAPAGRDLLYVLAPAPNLARGTVDWDAVGPAYADGMVAAVADRLPQLGVDAELLHVVNPADWARQGMVAGTPFALAHTFGQTGPFRPANTVRGIDNVVLAGSSTVPGVGVPTALHVGTAGGRPRHRGRQPARSPHASEEGRHDSLRARRGRRARPWPTGSLRTVQATERRARQDLLPRDPAAWLRSNAPRCMRCTGSRVGPTTSSTTWTTARPRRQRAERLQLLATQLFNQLVQHQDSGDDPTLRAVVHTARRYGIPWEMFDDFLASMRMDLTVTDYPDRKSLERYMHGSAEVIGLQMLPVLGTVGPREEAAPYAAALGKAFQLTNFLRDVDEDLQRGRVYLPADELAAHRVDRDMLSWCHANGRTDARVRRALTEQHAATRRVYETARKGIAMLDQRSQPCVSAAYTLYSEILDRIERHRLRDLQSARLRRHRQATAGRGPRADAGLARAVDAR